jgi:predicted amidohydrolase
MMLTIGLAQLWVNSFDKQLNLNRALATIETCKEKGVDYVLFPELFLTGFFIQSQVKELAEPVDGESIHRIRQKAKETGVGVIIGFAEADQDRFYSSAAFIERDGAILGVYRKVHLFDQEQEFFTPGEEFPIFKTALGKMAVMMTFDVEFPEMARIYAVNGAELILVLNAHHVPYEPHQELFLRTRALENQLFIAAANTVGLQESTLFFGESAVISPDGNCLANGGNDEELIVASFDLSDVYRAREEEPMKYLENRKSGLYKKHGLLL